MSNHGEQPAAGAGIYTAQSVKDTVLELLKYGLLEQSRKPNLYRDAVQQQEKIAVILEPLNLAMRIDDIRGLGSPMDSAPWRSRQKTMASIISC